MHFQAAEEAELAKMAGERAKLRAQRDVQLAQLEELKARILAQRCGAALGQVTMSSVGALIITAQADRRMCCTAQCTWHAIVHGACFGSFGISAAFILVQQAALDFEPHHACPPLLLPAGRLASAGRRTRRRASSFAARHAKRQLSCRPKRWHGATRWRL